MKRVEVLKTYNTNVLNEFKRLHNPTKKDSDRGELIELKNHIGKLNTLLS